MDVPRSTLQFRARRLLERIKHCEDCGHDGSEHRLEVHHVNGDWSDNSLDNVRKLCSVCHGKADAKLREPEECSVDGCEDAKHSRGRCLKHYMRWYRETRQGCERTAPRDPGEIPKTETVQERQETSDTCIGEECELPVKSRGMCASHYGRWYRRETGQSKTGVPVLSPLRDGPGRPDPDDLE